MNTKYIYILAQEGKTFLSLKKLAEATGISYNTLAYHFSRKHNGKKKYVADIKGYTIYKLRLI